MLQQISRQAQQVGDWTTSMYQMSDNLSNFELNPAGTLGTIINYSSAAHPGIKATWNVGRIAAGAASAAGNYYQEKLQNEAGTGNVNNDVSVIDATIHGLDSMFKGLQDSLSHFAGMVGSYAVTRAAGVQNPVLKGVLNVAGGQLASSAINYFTGNRKSIAADIAVDMFWKIGTSTVGAQEYYKDYVAFTYQESLNKSGDKTTMALVSAISGYVGGEGWKRSVAEGVATYGEGYLNDQVASADVSMRTARFKQYMIRHLVKSGLLDVLNEGRLKVSRMTNVMQGVRNEYSTLDKEQLAKLFDFGTSLTDSGKAALYMRLGEEGIRKMSKEETDPMRGNYTVEPNKTADSAFAGQGETYKLLSAEYDGGEENDAYDWLELLKLAGVLTSVGGLSMYQAIRQQAKRADASDKQIKTDMTAYTGMSNGRTRRLFNEATMDAEMLTEMQNQLEDGKPNELMTPQNTTSSEKIYNDFINKLKQSGTFRVPPIQQVYEMVAAAASRNSSLVNAPDYAAPSKSSLGYMAGSYIRNKLHLVPVISSTKAGTGIRRFNRSELNRRMASRKSYNNFK